jgi:hypothetical protein
MPSLAFASLPSGHLHCHEWHFRVLVYIHCHSKLIVPEDVAIEHALSTNIICDM